MIKKLLIGTTALAIAGATFAYAQQPPRGPERHWRPSAEDIAAFTDARIAALKAGLKLTPDQEKNWPAVEAALRDLAKQRAERMAARASARPERGSDNKADAKPEAKPDPKRDAERRDPIERLRYRADMMTQTGANLKKLADAAAPLYQSLDEAQKNRFQMLARVGMREFGGEGMRGPRGHMGHHGFGFGRFERDGGPQDDGPRGPGRGPRGDGPRGEGRPL